MLVAALLLCTGSTAREAAAQGFGGRINYTGEFGPVNTQRPLCICVFADPALTVGLGCLIVRRNDSTYDVVLGRSDYYLIAFLDIHVNERLDDDEPYEIFQDRDVPPADAVAGTSGRTDVDFIFGDENLSAEPTDTTTPTPSATPSPTDTPSPMPSPTPTPTDTATPTETPICETAQASDCTGACAGDCNGNGEVELSELITIVRDALAPVTALPCGDADGNGAVEIEEILAAVGRNLTNCLALRDPADVNSTAGPPR